MRVVHGTEVFGIDVDDQTGCAHYHSSLDIIAIKFKCCGEWFSCFECHESITDHEARVWSKDEREARAILCGKCGNELTIKKYLNSNSVCPKCKGAFNPGCINHFHLYFA